MTHPFIDCWNEFMEAHGRYLQTLPKPIELWREMPRLSKVIRAGIYREQHYTTRADGRLRRQPTARYRRSRR